MKQVNGLLFNELRRGAANVVLCWLMTRTDGFQLGFTSSDVPVYWNGVTYQPTNAFSGTASTAKNNLSVDNMNAISLISDLITEQDLRGGRYDNADVKVFWISADHPEYGILPMKGGTFGELNIKNGQFEIELRAVMQLLQQPFGKHAFLQCNAEFGDGRCKVPVDEYTCGVWQPNRPYYARAGGKEGGIGSWVRPSVYNGNWYRCLSANGQQSSLVSQPSIEGTWGDADLYVSPTQNGDPPPSAPDDFQVLTYTLYDCIINKVQGISGGYEPNWNGYGFYVPDGQLVWQAFPAKVRYGVVTAIYNRAQFEDYTRGEDAQYWDFGTLTFTTGRNAGFSMEIRKYERDPTALFTLLEQMPNPITPGDQYKIKLGCPKTRNACIGFENINNFRGFPDMPTEDKALATPNFMDPGTPTPDDQGGS